MRIWACLLALLFSCAPTGAQETYSVTLSWQAPTHNTDGTPLTDLAGYRIYSGCEQSGQYERDPVEIDNPDVTSYVMDGLSGECYFVATAFNGGGIESDHSGEAVFEERPGVPVIEVEWREHVEMAVETSVYIAFQTTTNASSINKTWNSTLSTASGQLFANLLDSDGNPTGWTLSTDVPRQSSSTSGYPFVGTGEAAWVDEPVISDEFQWTSSDQILAVTIGGLDNSKTYNIGAHAASALSPPSARTLAISLDNFATELDWIDAGQNDSQIVLVSSVAPQSGFITVYFRRHEPQYLVLGAMFIEEVAAAGGQTIPVGQVGEENQAGVISVSKSMAVGLTTESDSAFMTDVGTSIPIGLAIENESTFAVATSKRRSAGPVAESNIAPPVTANRTYAAGLATENGTAQPVITGSGVPIGLPAENDSAFTVSSAKGKTAGLVAEADSSFPVSVVRAYPLDVASEVDVAFDVERFRTKGIGPAIERDRAFTVIGGEVKIVQRAKYMLRNIGRVFH